MKTTEEIKKWLDWDEVDKALQKVRLADAGEDDMGKPKTSDDIKQGLQCCSEDGCVGCPYEQECREADGFTEIAKDTLVLIQQLEADNAQQARCIENLADKLNALNDALPRWISVEERLPEHGKNVLVHVANRVGMWHTEIDWQKDNGEWANNADCEWNTVTHWMPLPEPPEEG